MRSRWLHPTLRKSFLGEDRVDFEVIQSLQDRMLTGKIWINSELVSASICDRLQVKAGFIAVLEGGKIDRVIQTGDKRGFASLNLDDSFLQEIDSSDGGEMEIHSLGDLKVMRLEDVNGGGSKTCLECAVFWIMIRTWWGGRPRGCPSAEGPCRDRSARSRLSAASLAVDHAPAA